MKKVAIVTIISRNYGNRLQNYALQEVLKKDGVCVETIPLKPKSVFERKVKFLVKKVLSKFVKKYKKDVRWDYFDSKIKWSNYTSESEKVCDVYDYFIAGSDQIWNPTFDFNSEREFLTFANNKQKIAYAASIGLEELPSEYEKIYRRNILLFKMVSVRENAAADIIVQLGCERPFVVLDPTMLLSLEEWKQLMRKSKIRLKKKYVVKYFLGIKNVGFDQYINQYAKSRGAEVIDIIDYDNIVGPIEFLNLIYYSEAVFTDSFHGTVFSVLFHKPFIVFERPYEEGYGKMSSRLDTLLNTFCLKEQRVFSVEECIKKKPEWDYECVDLILQERKKMSRQILMNAIGVNL